MTPMLTFMSTCLDHSGNSHHGPLAIYVSNGFAQIRNESDDFCHFLCCLHPDFTLGIEIGERSVDFFREFRADRKGRAQRDDSDNARECHVVLLGFMVALVP